MFINLYTEMGGGEYAVYNLLKEIDRTKIRPIMMFNKRGEFVEKIESIGVETVIVPYRNVMLRALIYPWKLWDLLMDSKKIYAFIKNKRPDVIQCSDVISLFLIAYAVIRLRFHIVYNVIFYYERIRLFVFNILAFFFIKKIITNSVAVKNDIIKKTLFISKKIEVNYPGVDMSIFHPRNINEKNCVRKELGIEQSIKLVGMVGRFEPSKGHKFLLRAIPHIKKNRTDVKFILIGSPLFHDVFPFFKKYYDEVMECYHSLNLGDSVIFLPHRNDISEIMASLDVLVCPSLYEGFGLVILEALASGVPVVATKNIGGLEIVHDLPGVFISEPADEISIAEQVLNAIDFVAAKSQNPSSYVKFSSQIDNHLKRYTWAEYARRTEQIYIHIVN